MAKTLVVGIAACAALALLTGANATERHHKHRIAPHDGAGFQSSEAMGPERGVDYGGHLPVFQLPAQPAQDCLHVLFPQCDRGQYR